MDFGHIAPDWEFLMKKGIVGVLERLHRLKKTSDKSKYEFYDNCTAVYEAIIAYIKRLASVAEKFKTDKMRFCAENLTQLTVSAPQNIAQAMQLTFLIYLIQWRLDGTQIRSLGGIDRLYYPFFKNDVESKTFTLDQIRELTDDFLWKISATKVQANTPFNICGKDKNGVTALINSILKLNLENFPGSCVADIVLHRSAVCGTDGMSAFYSLLKTYMNCGGASIHFNVLDPQSLIAAQKEPEKYKNLQIRLCGWNVRFIDLNKKEQDEFIIKSTMAQ